MVASSRRIPRCVLKGPIRNIGTLTELCRTCDIDYGNLREEMLCSMKLTVAKETLLHTDSVEVGLLPLEQFSQLTMSS